ncbi:MAG: PKD domain-containing protein [Myxococcota bacterium]
MLPRFSPRCALSLCAALMLAARLAIPAPLPDDVNWDDHLGGTEPIGEVHAMVVAPDGTVYLAGQMAVNPDVDSLQWPVVARFDSATREWSEIGRFEGTSPLFGLETMVLVGDELIVGGAFDSVDGVPAANVARWSATSDTWSALGSGTDGVVHALAPEGTEVYVGGGFQHAGGIPAGLVARWDLQTGSWSALGTDFLTGDVLALAVDASGLYAGGAFVRAGSTDLTHVAHWSRDTGSWGPVGSGVDGTVYAIAPADSGEVFFGGEFTAAGGLIVNNLAVWERTLQRWSGVGGGVDHSGPPPAKVKTLLPIGSELWVGGGFETSGGIRNFNLAIWDRVSQTWLADVSINLSTIRIEALAALGSDVYVTGSGVGGSGFENTRFSTIFRQSGSTGDRFPLRDGLIGRVSALAARADEVWMAGRFLPPGSLDSIPVHLARWDVSTNTWTPVDQAPAGITSLVLRGDDLYVAGGFSEAGGAPAANIAHLNLSSHTWSPLGAGVEATIRELSAAENGDLYALGRFRIDFTGLPSSWLARWDSAAQTWTYVPSRVTRGGELGAVAILGDDIYVGGRFIDIEGVAAENVARFDPATGTWAPLGSGIDRGSLGAGVLTMAAAPEGLFVGGTFVGAGGSAAQHIALWDPVQAQWSTPGTGVPPEECSGPLDCVVAMTVLGSDLYVGGQFGIISGVAANGIARRSGVTGLWSGLGSGTLDSVYEIAADGPDVYLRGNFMKVGGKPSPRVAHWRWNDAADLSVTLVDDPDPVPRDQTLRYTARITNSGPALATGVAFSMPLPAGFAFGSATPSQGACSTIGGLPGFPLSLVCDLQNLAPGGTATAVIEGSPTAAGPLGATARVSANEFDPDTGGNTGLATTEVLGLADLAVGVTAAPDPVASGETLHYGVSVMNHGPDPASQVRIRDTLPTSHVRFLTAAPERGSCSELNGVVTCTIDTLVPAETVRIDIAVEASSTGQAANVVTVSGAISDPDGSNDFAIVRSDIQRPNDVSVTMTASPEPVPFGGDLTYDIVVWNHGPDSVLGVTLTDTLPAGVSLVSATPTSCTETGGVVSCDLGGLLGSSGRFVTLVVRPSTTGLITNTARVSTTSVDPDPSNDVAEVTSTVLGPPSISIGDVVVIEGDAGTRDAQLAVTLSTPAAVPVGAAWHTVGDTATSDVDFLAALGEIAFPPGTDTQIIGVGIVGDLGVEPDERFFVELTQAQNATLLRPRGEVTIRNDDSPIRLDPGGPYSGIEGEPIRMSADAISESGPIERYEWDLGDGTLDSGNPIWHAYAQQGEYAVAVRVTDALGFTLEARTGASVLDTGPTASFHAGLPSCTPPWVVSFTDTSTAHDALSSWEWTFDDRSPVDTSQNPTHSFELAGTYKVQLVVVDADGSRDAIAQSITVGSPLLACQGLCGDVNGDGLIDPNDVDTYRAFLADPIGSALPSAGETRCSVIGGPDDCDIADVVVLRRFLAEPSQPPGIDPVCAAAIGP